MLSAGAEIQTLQIAGDAVTVPSVFSYGQAYPSYGQGSNGVFNTTGFLGDTAPTTAYGAAYLNQNVSAKGGRLMVTVHAQVQSVITGDNQTSSCLMTVGITAGSTLFNQGAFSGNFNLPNNGSSYVNLTVPMSFSGASTSTIGTLNSSGNYGNTDNANVKVYIAGSKVRILSATMTIMSCKR